MEYRKMELIGGMTNFNIAKISGFESRESRNQLEGKVVVDLGAGVSGYLSSLGIENATLCEVDPVYGSEKLFEEVRQVTENVRRDYLFTLLKSEETDNPKLAKLIEVFRDVLRRVQDSSHEAPDGIKRYEQLEDVPGEIDILFCTYVFTVFENPKEALEQIAAKMSSNGKVFIIENSNNEGIIKFLRANIRDVKGVIIKKSEDDKCCITIPKKSMPRVLRIINRYKKTQN